MLDACSNACGLIEVYYQADKKMVVDFESCESVTESHLHPVLLHYQVCRDGLG